MLSYDPRQVIVVFCSYADTPCRQSSKKPGKQGDMSRESMTRQALLDQLVESIISIEHSHPLRVAIDGIDAAGKTTLADELVHPLEPSGRPVIRVSIDGFHRPRREPCFVTNYFLALLRRFRHATNDAMCQHNTSTSKPLGHRNELM